MTICWMLFMHCMYVIVCVCLHVFAGGRECPGVVHTAVGVRGPSAHHTARQTAGSSPRSAEPDGCHPVYCRAGDKHI